MKKEFNEKKIHPVSTAINMFDFAKKDIDLRGLFYDVMSIFEEAGVVPTLFSAEGVTEHGYITLKNGIKKLEACDFKRVENLWVCATPSSDLRNPFKWLMSVYVDFKPHREVFSLDFDSELIPFTAESMEGLFKRIEPYCGARYGYAVQRPFEYSGFFYACGTDYNLPEFHKDPSIRAWAEREGNLITQWSHAYHTSNQKYKTGDLRQIYPYNLLCKEHLERPIGEGKTLQQWISESPKHGTVKEISEGRWMWCVDKEEIDMVTKALEGSGIILCL